MKTVSLVANVLGQVTMCSSVLMIVAFTFERHFAIRSPHQYRLVDRFYRVCHYEWQFNRS